MLVVADYDEARATKIAETALAIDTVLHGGELDPVLKVDTRNQNNPRSFDELQAATTGFDFGAYFTALGLSRPDGVILMDPDFTKAVSNALDRFTLQQLKDYLALRMIASFSSAMSTDFEGPRLEITRALFGAAPKETREERAVTFLRTNFGQPLGRLYVDKYFTREKQETGLDMIRRIQANFRARIEANKWLSEETRKASLEKVDKLYYRFGYPDEWIDYSAVGVSDDLVRSKMNINRFEIARMASLQNGDARHWDFSDREHTYPTIVNAAYNPTVNGFEVAAAIAQPPAFQADMDAPVYFCRLGAAIAHEMTHGFDTSGRNFDANGTMRSWWKPADTAYFDSEAKKLVAQGDRYEALPGHFMSGGLTVGENLADIGGMKVAHDALMQYLAEHPEENVKIDGLTPSQRCFISWAQLWVEKRSEQSMMNQLEDNHAPGNYRALAPLQQVPAFYEAFNIKEGDPMWVAPEDRINIW
jgi:predicted metalloendopeptidase